LKGDADFDQQSHCPKEVVQHQIREAGRLDRLPGQHLQIRARGAETGPTCTKSDQQRLVRFLGLSELWMSAGGAKAFQAY
jgi:hypothetical protein